MSRIGRWPIPIPDGVKVEEVEGMIRVTGPGGTLEEVLPRGVRLEQEDGRLRVHRLDERKAIRARHGLTRAIVANMVKGVTEGFTVELEIQGVGYRADVSGGTLRLTLGFSHPVEVPIPEGIEVSVERNVAVTMKSRDKRALGQFAADVRALRPPEPYKGKGIRYATERVRRKVGKAGAS